MEYKNICKAEFISRPNRFIAELLIQGQRTNCHVKNTGRCKELLTSKAVVYVERNMNPERKTPCSLIAVRKGERIVNIDSQAPNKVFYEALLDRKIKLPGFEEITYVKAEKTYKRSRFDFYVESHEKKAFIEVKGVTLEENGVAKFPDAPTVRGVKHILELVQARREGYYASIVFIIQMNRIQYFTPNDETHGEFGEALRLAAKEGVNILAYECDVTPCTIDVNGKECPIVL
ncbi:MAG: DNA/RNA nuclease SfsA [Clostridiaceae bacterium]|nr:DNA/RNA nuclease SfsA [Clostridiaceae bacterium]